MLVTSFIVIKGWMALEPVMLVDGVEILVSVMAHVKADKKTAILHCSWMVYHGGLYVSSDKSSF